MAATERTPGPAPDGTARADHDLAPDSVRATATAARPAGRRFGAIVMAACALPGVFAPEAAQAELAPERGVIGITFSSYQEGQGETADTSANGLGTTMRATSATGTTATITAASRSSGGSSSSGSTSGSGSSSSSGSGSSSGTSSTSSASRLIQRVKVTSPSLYALLPLGRHWSIEGSGTIDRVSGASPSYYTDTDSFSSFKDTRRAADAKLTRYWDRQSLALGVSRSKETDYLSQGATLEGRWASQDQNTTFNLGLAYNGDTINPSNGVVSDARKRVREVQLGLTQVLGKHDIVQVNWSASRQAGYLDDPYKSYDVRPDTRQAQVLQLRWNHWLGFAALKTGWRIYDDDWGVRSHTLEAALAFPMGEDNRSTITPDVRWYTQSAARFYVPWNGASVVYPVPTSHWNGYTTLDQRLAAWGAVTAGLKIDAALDADWSASAKISFYRQQASLRLIDEGSGGLAPLTAWFWQVGVRRAF